MIDIGLFGLNVRADYDGVGVDYTTFARVFEEWREAGWAWRDSRHTPRALRRRRVVRHRRSEAALPAGAGSRGGPRRDLLV